MKKFPPIVTIFGSSQVEENVPDYQKAALVGRMVAEAGFTVCSGGYGGIMEASSRGAKEAGGQTIGIIAEEFNRKPNRWLDEVRVAKTWRERLFQLIDAADAFIVFDGGTGTLVELSVAWEMTNKKLIQKPIIIIGACFGEMAEDLKKQRFFSSNPSLKIAKTTQEIIDFLHEAF